jgi:hypothetical protein
VRSTKWKTKKKKMQRTKETKRWFFEKINMIDEPQANLTKMSSKRNQINKIRNKKGEISTHTEKIQGIIKGYFV